MAPTEILAEQHFATIARLLAPTRFRVALLTGTRAAARREALRGQLAAGRDRPGRRHARARPGRRRVQGARVSWSSTSSTGSACCSARRCAQGAAARHARDDGDADSAHAGADDLRRPRRVDASASCRPGRHADHARRRKPDSRRDEIYEFIRARARRRPAGVRRLSDHRGVGEDRSARGDRDGRSPGARRVPGVPRRRCCTGG